MLCDFNKRHILCSVYRTLNTQAARERFEMVFKQTEQSSIKQTSLVMTYDELFQPKLQFLHIYSDICTQFTSTEVLCL